MLNLPIIAIEVNRYDQPTTVFFFNKSDVHICFRIFGYGLNFINRAKQPALYSVRSGKTKQWKVYGDWHMMVLKPTPKNECVGRP